MHIDTLLLQILYFKQTCMTCGLVPDQEALTDFIIKMVEALDVDIKQKEILIQQVFLIEDYSYEYIGKQLEKAPKKVFGKKENNKAKKSTIAPNRNIKIC